MATESKEGYHAEDLVEVDDPLSDLDCFDTLLDIGRVVAFDDDVELVPYSDTDCEVDVLYCESCPPGCHRNYGGAPDRGMAATVRVESDYGPTYYCCDQCLADVFDPIDVASGNTRYTCLEFEEEDCDIDTRECLEVGHCHIDNM